MATIKRRGGRKSLAEGAVLDPYVISSGIRTPDLLFRFSIPSAVTIQGPLVVTISRAERAQLIKEWAKQERHWAEQERKYRGEGR